MGPTSRRTRFPIRVVDVPATMASNGGIYFVAPTGWDFHVISHAWNSDVLKLADEIKIMIRAGALNSSSYSQAFQNADFTLNSCYRPLMDFLGLLAQNGVRRIWFDTLCINQENANEKNVEIPRMGSYYSKSEGCYVLLHGVGGGHKVWHGHRENLTFGEEAPRWFTRVWTLQEFLLPKTLIFIVGELSQWTLMYLQRRMEVANATVGFCRCCLLGLEVYPNSEASAKELLELCGAGDMKEEADLLEPINSMKNVVFERRNEKCAVCGSLPLVRRASESPGELVYLVDREAYIFIVSLERWSPPSPPVTAAVGCSSTSPQINSYAPFFSLISLFNTLEEGYMVPGRITDQVRYRNCSVQEDRILGILGLLGLDDLPQISTGKKSLEEQIVAVARVCKVEELIQSLIAVYYDGNKTEGMSWAPNLLGMLEDATHYQRNDQEFVQLVPEIEIADVNTKGIRLSRAKILHACINYTAGSDLEWHPFIITGQSTSPLVSSDLSRYLGVKHFCWYPLSTLRLKVYYFPNGSQEEKEYIGQFAVNLGPSCPTPTEMHKRKRLQHTFPIEFPMSILLLGLTLDPQYNKSVKRRMLAMACLQNSEGELHKIGLLSFPVKLGYELFETYGCVKECVIGGFGTDLSDYIISK